MKAMVKTYGQMPLQLFREAHAPRTKSTVLTNFRVRLGNVLKRFTTVSPLIRVTSSMFWSNITLHRAKMGGASSDNDFIGAQGKSEFVYSHVSSVDRTPEKLVYIGNGELIVTEMRSLFYLSTSLSSSSLLVLWGTWDNSLIVRSTVNESSALRLHSNPFNKVSCDFLAYSYEVFIVSRTQCSPRHLRERGPYNFSANFVFKVELGWSLSLGCGL